jgi:hypothetical protein
LDSKADWPLFARARAILFLTGTLEKGFGDSPRTVREALHSLLHGAGEHIFFPVNQEVDGVAAILLLPLLATCYDIAATMAPNNKKGARTNKKNKGRAGLAPTSTPSATASSSRQDSLSALRNSNLPTFHRSNVQTSGTTGGYYEFYKRATTRFCAWMREALPESKLTSVNDLRKGAEAILARNILSLEDTPPDPIVTPKEVMAEPSASIQYRQLLTDTKFAETGGDVGHRYMIQVLCYCRSVLRFGRRVAKVAILESSENAAATITGDDTHQLQDLIGGRFNALVEFLSCPCFGLFDKPGG